MDAWEVREDGTVWPVEVVSGRSPFGFYRVRRGDGSVAPVYAPNLRSAENIDVRYERKVTT